jgi:hypothetical protein
VDYLKWRDDASPLVWLYGIRELVSALNTLSQLLILCSGLWENNFVVRQRHFLLDNRSYLTSCLLSSTVIEDVDRHKPTKAAVAYFYFDFRDSAKQAYGHALRSLLEQLCSRSNDAFRVLDQLYNEHGAGRQPPANKSLVKALRKIVAALPRTYIILDALDECPNRDELLEFLKEAVEWKVDDFHVLVTSRHMKDIEEALDTASARRVCLQSQLVNSDIETYIRSRLRDDKALAWPPSVQREIEHRLTEGACGM